MATNPLFTRLLENIPDYQSFLTVDELDESSRALAEHYPDAVSLFEMGRTKDGHPLLCLKIGDGPQNALMFGCPHPNEPIGPMMLEYFTEELAKSRELRDALGYTWYIVKAWDADGLRLNEKWLKGPYTIYNYSRNFFRPAGHRQVDWTFPIDYKDLHFHDPIPETTAMMALIDQVKPSFIYSLHNAGFGGVYWYLSRPLPALYEEMYAAADRVKVPLNLGEPEAPYCVPFAPAIYQSLGIEQDYDYTEKYAPPGTDIGARFKVGNCSESYARTRHGSFTLLTELPYFFDKRIMDLSTGTMTRRDAVLRSLETSEESDRFLLETMELSREYFQPLNPFKLALEAFTKPRENDATRNMVNTNPDFAKTATVAEEFDNLLLSRFYKALSYGMLIRVNEYELEEMARTGEENPRKDAALKTARDIDISRHREITDQLEQEFQYEVVPIRKLVSIQLECGLLVSQALREEKGGDNNG